MLKRKGAWKIKVLQFRYFNPTQASDYIQPDHGVQLSRGTLPLVRHLCQGGDQVGQVGRGGGGGGEGGGGGKMFASQHCLLFENWLEGTGNAEKLLPVKLRVFDHHMIVSLMVLMLILGVNNDYLSSWLTRSTASLSWLCRPWCSSATWISHEQRFCGSKYLIQRFCRSKYLIQIIL